VQAVHRVLGYLRKYPNYGLEYTRNPAENNFNIEAYSDASYGDDYSTGRSTIGSCIFNANGPVMWKSMLLNFVVNSSTASEYAAINETVLVLEFVMNVLTSINSDINKIRNNIKINNADNKAINNLENACNDIHGVRINVDNLAAIHIANNDCSSKRAKHINVRFMYVKEAIQRGKIELKWISTKEQLADFLTKCLNKDKFNYFKKYFVKNCISG
jgi:hypothetical protein